MPRPPLSWLDPLHNAIAAPQRRERAAGKRAMGNRSCALALSFERWQAREGAHSWSHE